MARADSLRSIEKRRVISIEELVGRGGCRSASRDSAVAESDCRSAAVVDRVRGVLFFGNAAGNDESLPAGLGLLSFSASSALGGPICSFVLEMDGKPVAPNIQSSKASVSSRPFLAVLLCAVSPSLVAGRRLLLRLPVLLNMPPSSFTGERGDVGDVNIDWAVWEKEDCRVCGAVCDSFALSLFLRPPVREPAFRWPIFEASGNVAMRA